MALFGSPFSALMDQRLQWLAKRSELLSHNLASANLPHAVRKDLKDFQSVLKRHAAQNANPRPSGMHIDPLIIQESDIIEKPGEVSTDLETLEMSQNALEHEFMINIMKKFHQLVRTASARVQN